MAVNAETHVEIDVAPGYRLVSHVTVAGRAIDVGADVGSVIEPDVRFPGVPVDPLPLEIEALCFKRRDLFDQWTIRGDRLVTDHASSHARKPGYGSCRYAFMAVFGARHFLFDVGRMR